ncbi:MAG: hypothetical protein HY835_11760, partial [Anaerolineae bacterium]|nr:hypothetical protein [Anaerolineae bacterium]
MKQDPGSIGMPAPELAIRLLGGFSVSIHGQEIPDSRWRLHKVKNLVKLLALARAHRLHRDQLIDTLWPESDPKAGSNLFYQTLHFARQVLADAGSNYLCFQDGFLSLSDGVWIDTEQFEQTAAHARHCQEPAEFHRALAFYTGCLLPEDLYEDWTVQPREALRQAYLSLLLDLAGVEESRGNYTAGIQTLQRLLADDRSSETAHVGLMRLYALCGQRQQALRQYQILRDVLRAELDAEPSRYAEQLAEAIRCGRFAPVDPPTIESPGGDARKTNLPTQLTSFIGREKQIEDIRRLMNDHRLVTLTGAGGIGKTRLALAAAEGLLLCFPDGVFLVELAPLSDPNLVAQECTKSLSMLEQPGIPYADALAYYLKNKHLLLILDNCEHVVAACTQLAGRLLKECPRLHILTTSREVFSVPGEIPFRVPSLEVVDHHARPPLAEMARVEAVRLFIERAADVSPGLALTEENAGWIAQIGQRLDGIPLAIELAAARTRLLTVEQIATRLDNLFHLLTSGNRAVLPRHQTLRACFDWSYNLLSPAESALLRQLSVFQGGWTLEVVEDIDKTEPIPEILPEDILTVLTQLLDRSLVVSQAKGQGIRYRLLDTIRQYAHEKLVEAGEEEAACRRHLACFLDLAIRAEDELHGPEQVHWHEKVKAELENIRAALSWALSTNPLAVLRIMSALAWFWRMQPGLQFEGLQWLMRGLDVEVVTLERDSEDDLERALVRGWALNTAAFFQADILGFEYRYKLYRSESERQAAYTRLDRYSEEALALFQAIGKPGRRGLAFALLQKSEANPERAKKLLEECYAIFQEEGEKFYMAECLERMGAIALWERDLDQVRVFYQQLLDLRMEIGDLNGLGYAHLEYGNLEFEVKRFNVAKAHYEKALAIFQKIGFSSVFIVRSARRLAHLANTQCDFSEALRYSEIALATVRESGEDWIYAYGLQEK